MPYRVTGLKMGPNDPSVWAPDFGAVGDSATDDTVALQTMFAVATSTGRTRINIPAGNWVFSQKLAFGQNGIHLEGASLNSTRLTFKPATHSVVFTVGTGGPLGTMTMTYALDSGSAVSVGSTAATLGGNFVFTIPGTAIDAIFPPGSYVSTATYTLSTLGVVTNSGGGPTMTYELVGIQLSAGTHELAVCGVHRLSFYSSGGNVQKKIALDIVDCDEPSVRDIYVDPTWAGSNSEGIRVRGRQSTIIDNIRSWADIPIHIAADPNVSSPVNCDHLHISNTYLVPTPGLGNACLLIDSGVVVSNLLIDGDNAWIVDKYGLYWNDTSTAQTSNNVVIKNVRCEQMQDATGYGIYIGRTGAANLQNLLLENVMLPLGQNGVLVQNTLNVTIKNCPFQANTSGQCHLDVSTGVSDLLLLNNLVQINATVNLGTMVQQFAAPKRLSGQNMPSTAHYADASTAAAHGFQISAILSMLANKFLNGGTANTQPIIFDTVNAFTAGNAIVEFLNQGVLKAYLDNGGSFYSGSGIFDTPSSSAGPISVGPNFATRVQLATATTDTLIQGGLAIHRTIVADANYSCVAGDMIVAYTSLTAGRTVTLPGASGRTGRVIVVKNESSGAFAITVAPSSGTVDGAASIATTAAAHAPALRVYSDGTNWNSF